MKRHRKLAAVLMAMAVVLISSGAAWALDDYTPTGEGEDDFAYTIYEIVVEKMLKGAIGRVAGIAFLVLAAVQAARNNLVGSVPAIVAAALLLKADTIVESFGAIV